MKRLTTLLVSAGLALAVAGCSDAAEAPSEETAAASEAGGADPERLRLARELVEVMEMEGQLDFVMQSMRPVMQASILGELQQSPGSRSALAEIDRSYPGGQAGFGRDFANRFGERFRAYYPEILDEAARFYARELSEEQLEATLDFFRSDAGSEWIEITPDGQQHMSQVGMRYGQRAAMDVAETMMGDVEGGGDR